MLGRKRDLCRRFCVDTQRTRLYYRPERTSGGNAL